MERLTNKKEADAQRNEYEIRLAAGYPRNIPEERFLKLAAYEDTGLDPGEIKEHEAAYTEIMTRTYGPLHEKIGQWLQAEKDGRLVVLPRKPEGGGLNVKLRICFEIGGLGEDEHGNPAPGGLAVTLGETSEHVDYQEFVQDISIEGVLKSVCLDSIVRSEDVKIITPEEFDEKYGDDWEEDQ